MVGISLLAAAAAGAATLPKKGEPPISAQTQRSGGAVDPDQAKLQFDSADLSPMARSFYAECKRISNAAMKQRLGVRLTYPTYREALDALFAAGEGR